MKAWRLANPDKNLADKRRQEHRTRAARRDEYNARRRTKRARNSDTGQAAFQRRYEWLAAGDVTGEQLREIFVRAGGSCLYCGTSVRARFNPADPRGFDHVIARANGGQHTAGNIVVSCGPCNARKAAK